MTNWTTNGQGSLEVKEDSLHFAPSGDVPLKPLRGFYFLAPKTYLGQQINSYGGRLTYKVSSAPDGSSARSLSPEVILKVSSVLNYAVTFIRWIRVLEWKRNH